MNMHHMGIKTQTLLLLLDHDLHILLDNMLIVLLPFFQYISDTLKKGRRGYVFLYVFTVLCGFTVRKIFLLTLYLIQGKEQHLYLLELLLQV